MLFRFDGIPFRTRTVTLANGSSYVADGEGIKRFGVEVGAGISAAFGRTDIGLSYEGKFKEHHTTTPAGSTSSTTSNYWP